MKTNGRKCILKKKKKINIIWIAGLEPTRHYSLDSKSSMFTNFIISIKKVTIIVTFYIIVERLYNINN